MLKRLNEWCLLAVTIATLSAMGCSSGSEAENGDGDCADNVDIAGGFGEKYHCWVEDACSEENVLIFLDIRIDPDDQDPSDGQDYTFCQTGGFGPLCIEDPPGTFLFSGSGTLCNDVFEWSAISPGRFAETGTWEFSDGGDSFEKTSVYVSIGGGPGGDCVGMGLRGGEPEDLEDCVDRTEQ